MFRTFDTSQTVWFLAGNYHKGKWLAGIITARLGDLHYEIEG